ncbi:hypothetical protein F5878DRAFT_537229 [Lentinula raphanica]|uniref:Integrase core domain-containing protein n=1 Tax=Lentinula raphanica TaxID=153919 RepID=A0AA38P9I8_9AGAR|nr:hypothetical protein F5878DRAFT_537229 [Lentinula raphanica]
MWGASTRNTRIERLWPEVGSQFARQWRAFFLRLERLHGLKREDPHHIWLLHLLFLPLINEDCQKFINTWNNHPISGRGHYQTPNDIRFFGELKHGRYDPPSPPVTNPLDQQATIRQIQHEQSAHYRHEPVATPKHRSPFLGKPDQLRLFCEAIEAFDNTNVIPVGYYLRNEEWENGEYPTFEIIPSGKRATKELRIDLPHAIWFPRAIQWGQYLHIMNYLSLSDI